MILVVVLCSCLMAVAVPYLVNRWGRQECLIEYIFEP